MSTNRLIALEKLPWKEVAGNKRIVHDIFATSVFYRLACCIIGRVPEVEIFIKCGWMNIVAIISTRMYAITQIKVPDSLSPAPMMNSNDTCGNRDNP